MSLEAYDVAPWATETCVDPREGKYFVVNMNKPEDVIAELDGNATERLDIIFKSAKQKFVDQVADDSKKKRDKRQAE